MARARKASRVSTGSISRDGDCRVDVGVDEKIVRTSTSTTLFAATVSGMQPLTAPLVTKAAPSSSSSDPPRPETKGSLKRPRSRRPRSAPLESGERIARRRARGGRAPTPLEITLRSLSRALATHADALSTSEPALHAHTSIASVIDALSHPRTPWPTKEALTRALIREHRRATVWIFGGALLVAYAPLLVCLRCRLRSAALDDDDLDQVLVDEFLGAVLRFDEAVHRDRALMHLHQNTRRAVFELLRREQQHWTLAEEIARDPEIDVFDVPAHRVRLSPEEADALAELLQERIGDAIERRKIQIVIDTHLRGLPIRGSVADGRSVDAVTRERSRTLLRVRALLAERIVRPCEEQAWLRGVVACP